MTAIETIERDRYEGAKQNAQGWYENIVEMLAKLDASGQPASDDAMKEIEESVLSVMVRDGWRLPNGTVDEAPAEFEILLSTGGPALRIWGTLDRYCQPNECELQLQDWGVPWLKWVPEPYDEKYRDNLFRFASCFYFGD